MGNILFSIVVPVYNQEKYLDECIKSVLEQDFSDFELILVDDGSTDLSSAICDKYKEQDERIKVIHKTNGGLPSARKAGAAIACGDYIVTLDSDDYMQKNSLAMLSNIVKEYSPDIISFDYISAYETSRKKMLSCYEEGLYLGDKLHSLKQQVLYHRGKPFFTFGLPPSTWTKTIKREQYLKAQTTVNNGIKMGEDVCVTFPAILNCNSLYILKEPIINYRILSTSISHNFRPNDIKDLKLLISHFENIDLDSYDAKNQFCVYILFRVFNSLVAFAQNLNDYNEYIRYAQEVDKYVLELLKQINKKTLDKKAKYILFFIKMRCWRAFWIFYNKRK